MSILPRFNKIHSKKGFTLIELVVVIAIIGSFMALGIQLLKSFWLKQSTGITSLEMMQLIDVAREKSLSTGNVYSLSMNVDKKVMELSEYDPDLEKTTSGYETDELNSDMNNNTVSEENSNDKSEKKPKKKKALFKSNLPSQISGFFSPSGIQITAPVFYLHFYPDGTSDSLIIKYDDREKPYHFIPRYGGNGVFLADLKMLNDEK